MTKRAWALIGFLTFVLGSLGALGWILRIPSLLQISSAYSPMYFNTALCILLGGFACMIGVFQNKTVRIIQTVIGLIIFTIGFLTILEFLFEIDFGIDQLFAKIWLQSVFNPYPGRMAFNSAFCASLVGLTFLLLPFSRRHFVGVSIEVSIFIVFLIGFLGLFGYLLDLEFLYTWYSYTRMALFSAVGFVLLGFALWGFWRSQPEAKMLYVGNEDTKLILLSSAILISVSLIITISNFASLVQQQEKFVGKNFQQIQSARSQYFATEVQNSVNDINFILESPLFTSALTNSNNGKPIQELTNFLKAQGYSNIELQDAKGATIWKTQQLVSNPEMKIPVPNSSNKQITLLWKQGWFIRIAQVVTSPQTGAKSLLIFEKPLTNLDTLLQADKAPINTGDILICQNLTDNQLKCLSTRAQTVFETPMQINNQQLPIAYAFQNHREVVTAFNPKLDRVLTAYGPIPGIPSLALIVEMKITEIYQPIFKTLQNMLPIVLIAILFSLLLLRLQVLPLIRRVVNAEKELIRSNRRLQESDERYALSVRGSNIGLWDWDIANDKIFFSPYFKSLLGYSDNEFPNQLESLKAIIHPEDYDRVFNLVDQHLTNHVPYEIEYRLKRKSGDYHWYHAAGQALWDEYGNPLRMAGSLTDITERKNIENRSAAQYAVTRLLADANSTEEIADKIIQSLCERLEWECGGLWLVDNSKNIICNVGYWQQPHLTDQVFANVSRKRSFVRGEGVPGRVWETNQPLWIYDINNEKTLPRFAAAKNMGLHSMLSFPLSTQNKCLGAIEFSSMRRVAPDESLLRLMTAIGGQLGLFIQRKNSETALRENEYSKTAILESASDSIITINEHGTINSCNPKTAETFIYKSRELINKNIDMLVPDLSKKLKRLAGESAIELVGIRKDGEEFPVELTVSDMFVSKQNTYVCIIRDITERKKVEKLKNEFVSVVSHELRTPLTSIRGSLGLILGGTVGDFTERAKMLLEIANNNCERLLLLINDILDIEKIEAGKMTFHMQKTNLPALISEVLKENKVYADQFRVDLKFDVPDKEIFVYADPDRLNQVIVNLLSNAIKFSKPNTQVKCEIEEVDNTVRVAVIDTGPGVPEDFRTSIFKKFSQADSSTTRLKGGTGLGLSISKAIIEHFGGSLNFINRADGSTFYFDLPNWQSSDEDSRAPLAPAEGTRVLIVEDDEDQGKYLGTLLEQSGYVIDYALSVSSAKELLENTRYEALLLDLILPDQDGIAFIRDLRASEKHRNLPIIVISIIAQTGKALLDGDAFAVVDWLDKPVDFNKLLKAMEIVKDIVPSKIPKVLHVEDDRNTRDIVETLLDKQVKLISAESLENAREYLLHEKFDLVILDLLLPDGNGTALLPDLAKLRTPVIVFSSVELDKEYAEYVSQALIKSKTTEEKLLKVLQTALSRKKVPI